MKPSRLSEHQRIRQARIIGCRPKKWVKFDGGVDVIHFDIVDAVRRRLNSADLARGERGSDRRIAR